MLIVYQSGSNVPLVAQCRPLCTISSSRQEKAVKAAGAGAALHSYRGPGAGARAGPLLLLTTGAAQLVINTTTATLPPTWPLALALATISTFHLPYIYS